MRRRLTIALVGVALASVLLVGAGILVLAQIGATDQATSEAIERVDVLADFVELELVSDRRRRPGAAPLLQRLSPALGFEDVQLVVIEPGGAASTIDGLVVREPNGPNRTRTPLAQLDPEELQALTDGEAIVLDSDRPAGATRAFAGPSEQGLDDDRSVTVLQSIRPTVGEGAGEGTSATLAVLARQPVVTVGQEARLWFLASAVAVLVGALVASVLLARRFATPITQIERATSAVAAGDFSARVAVAGDDELAQLGRSVNEMAAELERSKALDQQFLMSVSHDLRTPLTAIAGYGEALRDGAIDEPRRAGEVIRNQAARLERLVGDLLDLARLDANRFRLDMQTVDVAVVAGRTVAGLRPRAEQHGLACGFTSAGPTLATADPDRLGQAVGNLVDNAVKHAASMVTADVSAVGEHAVITVTDDGPGIAPVDLPHVFERLYVSQHQPARAENPSGMGLAIVRELVIAMGGTVEAWSHEPSGTTMTIRLPLLP